MDWADERYVRIYTRDTADWSMWPWQSRALLPLLLRKADRCGVVELGKYGVRGLASLLGMPLEVVEPGVAGLLEDGCLIQSETRLVVRNFLEAQEAPASDVKRAREYRERRRDDASRNVTPPSRNVSDRHEESRSITARHEASRLAVPSLAVPSQEKPVSAGASTPPAPLLAEPPVKKPKPEKPPNPRYKPTVELLCGVWLAVVGTKYEFHGKADGAAVNRLLGFEGATDAELERRFRAYLGDAFNVKQASLAHFANKWAGCSARAGPGRLPASAITEAAKLQHAKGTIDDF